MERNRDTLLLALYALPNPPDWELINRRACSAAKEPEEGSAASRSVEVGVVASCGRGGSVEGEPSLGAARANCGMYPVGRKRSGNGEGARDDGGVQHVPDNFRLDDTGKGRGAAGEPLRAPENFRLDYSRKGRGAAPENFLFDTAKKGRGAGRQCFLNKNLRSGHDAEEEGRAHGGLLLYRQDIDDRGCKNGAAAFGSVASSAGVPCSRGVSTATGEFFTMEKHRRVCDDKEHNAAGGCFGFNEEVPYNSNAPEVWPHSHPSHAMEKYDPVPELLLCCGEVLSKPWRSIWQETPLVFHDKKLVRPLVILKAASPGVVLNLTEQITNILEKHPCSIPYFRMDSSSWTGGQSKLSEWLTILSKKKASEIIIVNREEARSLEFPLDDMQSPCLTSLRLGFFSLQDLDIYCFNYSNLGTLDLIGCSFESIRLYYVIKDCKNLTHLGIGLSVKDVRISSESLEEIQIWKCNMTHLSIEFAPRLQKLVNGIHPIWKRYHVLVMIQETPALQEFENLLLPIHRVEVRGHLISYLVRIMDRYQTVILWIFP